MSDKELTCADCGGQTVRLSSVCGPTWECKLCGTPTDEECSNWVLMTRDESSQRLSSFIYGPSKGILKPLSPTTTYYCRLQGLSTPLPQTD